MLLGNTSQDTTSTHSCTIAQPPSGLTRSCGPRPGSHLPPGSAGRCGAVRRFGHEAAHCACREALRFGHVAISKGDEGGHREASVTRDWIMLTPTVVVPARIPEQPSGLLGPGRLPPTRQPSKDVRGETILAAVVRSAAGRVSAQCRLAPGLQKEPLAAPPPVS